MDEKTTAARDQERVAKAAKVLGYIVAAWIVLAVVAVLSVALYAALAAWLKVAA